MVRLVTITVPISHRNQVVNVLARLQAEEAIFHVLVSTMSTEFLLMDDNATANLLQCTFKTKDKTLQYAISELEVIGVGVVYGQIDVLALVLSKPAISVLFDSVTPIFEKVTPMITPTTSVSSHQSPLLAHIDNPMQAQANTLTKVEASLRKSVDITSPTSKPTHKKRKYRISDRMTVDEIASFIDDGNHLTFNYLGFLLCASLIAGTGLLGDSGTSVIASMLVSPMMGPILSIAFGITLNHGETIRRGARNEIIAILMTFLVGIPFGICGFFAYSHDYRSNEMVSRGQLGNLIYGSIVAFASGIAVVLGITMGGLSAIVGVAISASLLPPVVNSGICLSMALLYSLYGYDEDAKEYYFFSLVSTLLSLKNTT
jgi:uncharacterized hydrophobic protein (TIGR00271 family)